MAAAVQNFYLAYQNGNTEIRYFKFSVGGTISDYAVASSGSPYTNNFNPSLSTHDGDPVISWSGNTSSIPTVVIRRKTGSTWSTFKLCENGGAAYPSNNNSRGAGSDGSIISWTNMYNQSRFIKFVNGAYTSIYNLPYSGQDVQIGNGEEFEHLKAVTFYRSGSAPYGVRPLTYNFNTLQKSTSGEGFNYARLATVSKNGCEIVYGLGDVKLNGKNIQFSQISDLATIENSEQLNNFIRTEDFSLTPNDKLELSELSYIINREKSQLSLNDFIPVIELVNSISGSAIQIKNLSFENRDTLDVKTYYSIDCKTLPPNEYYLRVKLDVKGDYEYNLADCIYEENPATLNKENIDVQLNESLIPKEYTLEQNFPNPFNPNTQISYQLPKASFVTLKIFDMLGKEIATLVNEQQSAGRYEVKFEASSLASGVYIYKLQAGDFVSSKKMILMK